MTATLSTHVLDTAQGRPAAGVRLTLTRDREVLAHGLTDGDGRCPGLPPLVRGVYRLEYRVAEYFRACGVTLADPPFLDVIGVDFGVSGDGHYHVPLLVSPYAYSTYRGS